MLTLRFGGEFRHLSHDQFIQSLKLNRDKPEMIVELAQSISIGESPGELLIPEDDEFDKPAPVLPGMYDVESVQALLIRNQKRPMVIQYLAEMLEH